MGSEADKIKDMVGERGELVILSDLVASCGGWTKAAEAIDEYVVRRSGTESGQTVSAGADIDPKEEEHAWKDEGRFLVNAGQVEKARAWTLITLTAAMLETNVDNIMCFPSTALSKLQDKVEKKGAL